MDIKSLFVQEVFTKCTIDAPADIVYSIISDFANYATWENEMIITGKTQIGGKMVVKVKTANNGDGWVTLSAVMRQNDHRKIAFDNILLAPFLLRGRHRFEIVPTQNSQTMFINAEVFSGLVVPFIRKNTLLMTTRRFKEHINLALKRTAETAPAVPGTPSELQNQL